MTIIFPECTLDENDEALLYKVEWLNQAFTGAVAGFEPKTKTLYMPHDIDDEGVRHEVFHLLLDYFREVYKINGIWPFDEMMKEGWVFGEEWVVATYFLMYGTVKKAIKEV